MRKKEKRSNGDSKYGEREAEKEEGGRRRGDSTGDNGKNTKKTKKEKRNKIKESRFNTYKNIMVEAVSSNLIEKKRKKEV